MKKLKSILNFIAIAAGVVFMAVMLMVVIDGDKDKKEKKDVPLGGLPELEEINKRLCDTCSYKTSDIKPGQVWFFVQNAENPFKENDTILYQVIDIKGDYVQYIWLDKDTNSTKKDMFIVGSKLLTK